MNSIIYRRTLFVFCKVSAYLKAISKPWPQQWQDWIA
jgi:hypothetical protein